MKALREVIVDELAEIPSIIGRLIFLGAHRRDDTGHYCHPVLAAQFGDESVDAVLREMHVETYSRWLAFDREKRQKDVAWWMAREKSTPRELASAWINSGEGRRFLPVDAPDREAFLRELAIVLLLLSHDALSRQK